MYAHVCMLVSVCSRVYAHVCMLVCVYLEGWSVLQAARSRIHEGNSPGWTTPRARITAAPIDLSRDILENIELNIY